MKQWKPHETFPDYKFSSDGEVTNFRRGKEIPLIGTKCGMGYRAIDFRVDGKTMKREYIHRVVCRLFNGLPEIGMQCRHLDGNIYNNKAINLAWGTALENMHDKILHGTVGNGEKNPMAVLTYEKVAEMRRIREASNTPYYVIARDFGVSTMTAFRAVTKRAWAA